MHIGSNSAHAEFKTAHDFTQRLQQTRKTLRDNTMSPSKKKEALSLLACANAEMVSNSDNPHLSAQTVEVLKDVTKQTVSRYLDIPTSKKYCIEAIDKTLIEELKEKFNALNVSHEEKDMLKNTAKKSIIATITTLFPLLSASFTTDAMQELKKNVPDENGISTALEGMKEYINGASDDEPTQDRKGKRKANSEYNNEQNTIEKRQKQGSEQRSEMELVDLLLSVSDTEFDALLGKGDGESQKNDTSIG